MIKLPNPCDGFKSWLRVRRFKRLTREIDEKLADARRRHLPTRHILRAKYMLVHSALARSVWP